MRKIAVIGLGHVGVTVAYTIYAQGLCDELVLIDKNEKKLRAEEYDFKDAASRMLFHTEIKTGDYNELKDADVVITAFGDIEASVKSGDRFAELPINRAAAKEVGQKIKAAGFKGVVINISNPCDVITSILQHETQLPKNQVLGTGTFLDTARMQRTVGEAMNQDPRNVAGYVLGEHGNSQFIAWSTVVVNNKAASDLFTPEEIEKLDKLPVEGAWKVAFGKGYTSYAVATCAVRLAEAVLSNAHLFAPVSVYLDEYETYIGYPAIIGSKGIEAVVQLDLTEKEQEKMWQSARYIKQKEAK